MWGIQLLVLVLAAGGAATEDAAVAAARDAVRERMSVPESSIHLVDVKATRWGDASLGCPEKGHAYAQVVTDGYRVRLRVDERTFDVRVAGARAMICDRAVQEGESEAAATRRLYRQARADLASRLGIPEAEIEVRFIRVAVWPDETLGCKKAHAASPPAQAVPGYLIALSAEGKSYEYHADRARILLCEE